ncbi:MAG TPA: outer membrane beta-barrel family protein [Bacteroidia bacterium]|nr:outer membrane beta-barrel family protein [Bacteroidia bacterium]
MKNIYCCLFLFFAWSNSYAQFPSMPGGENRGGKQMNVGHFYGKVVDDATGKGIEYSTVQLFQQKKDSVRKESKDALVTGDLTKSNGDFSLEKLMIFGEYTIKISAFGYVAYENKISFNIKFDAKAGMEQYLNNIDKDLGNIALKKDTVLLKEVIIDGGSQAFEFSIDKKVYNVEKNPVNEGGTAVDVMKNVPTVNVDIDGNVTVRNASPQIFVDGRPTTMTLDQIPADAIQSVELITNPSAKYDASGGGAGILNIVLKKSRRIGYSGNLRAGVDSRGRFNGSGDVNAREQKINVFLGANYNQRKSKSTAETERNYFGDTYLPAIVYSQKTESEMSGFFRMFRGGVDYFVDNRNTITLSGNINKGKFNPVDDIVTENDTINGHSKKKSSTTREFNNGGGRISYKHLFPKAGHELTADFNYNRNKSKYEGDYDTKYFDLYNNQSGTDILQQLRGTSGNEFITFQSDYVKPVTEKKKIEGGVRLSIKTFTSEINNYLFNVLIPAQTSDYEYTDKIYAGYFMYTNSVHKFGYQAGLRVESYDYVGELFSRSLTFNNNYLVSLFPSVFLSYKFSEDNTLQLNYSRRINRPNFFQILPYTDYADSLNLSRGNPGLKPEFTNSFELSHQKNLSSKLSILASLYLKYTTDLITRYQVTEPDTSLNRNIIINTYLNANESYAYGAELTLKNTFSKKFDVMLNVNAYNSVINGENIEANLSNEQFTWFAKMNVNLKLPKNFSVQLSGDYQSETALPVSSGDARGGIAGGGGGGYGMGPQSTLQGYIKPNYSAEIALKKEFLKEKNASVTISVSDIFKTKKYESYSESGYFTQSVLRKRDQQFVRLNFSYRFGKFDVSLFKRKNTRNIMDQMQDIQQ